MYVNRWVTLSASALLQCSAGVSYCFSIYSSQLKDALGYSQAEIQGLASPLVALLVVGWLPGFVYDSLRSHKHVGPRVVLLIGLAEHVCGYLGLWLVASGRAVLPYWGMVGLTVMAFNGSNWIDTACIATNVHNFPGDRGSVVGVLKALVGMSASIFTTIYVAGFRPEALSFLLFSAVGPAVLGLLALPFLDAQTGSETVTEDGNCKGRRFGAAFCVVIMLALYQLGTSGLMGVQDGMPAGVRGALLGGLAALLLPLLFLWPRSGGLLIQESHKGCCDEEEAFQHPGEGQDHQGQVDGAVWVHISSSATAEKGAAGIQEPLLASCQDLQPSQGLERDCSRNAESATAPPALTVRECCASLNFWLLFATFGTGTGLGLMFVNNLGQLVESLGGMPDGQDVLVSLFSIFSAAGRLACGSFPEFLWHRYNVPRTAFLVGVTGLTAGVCLISAASSLQLLWLAAPLAGFAFGCHWSLMPPLASELFGMRRFATLYCLLQFATTFGTYAFATRLAGGVYELHGRWHGDEGKQCYGADCYRSTFIVGACAEGAAMLLAIALYLRTRNLYARKQEVRRLPENEDAEHQRRTLQQ
ncbi:g7366 [Coccomyxa viridis]|uniref:G7366 protein n=1 Tax=Coccomyxa viridis TaxID=1274662 RepID=A0ABP1FXP0_9CHLO